MSVHVAQLACRSEEKVSVLPAEVGRAEIGGGVANPEGGVAEESGLSEIMIIMYHALSCFLLLVCQLSSAC